MNNDGVIDIFDLVYINKKMQRTPSNPDLNKDGVIDSKDLAILKANLLSKNSNIIYDINNVTILDYVDLSKMFVKTPVIDNTNITSAFKDANFKNEVYKMIGKNDPVPILYSDVKNIKYLNISYISV